MEDGWIVVNKKEKKTMIKKTKNSSQYTNQSQKKNSEIAMINEIAALVEKRSRSVKRVVSSRKWPTTCSVSKSPRSWASSECCQ